MQLEMCLKSKLTMITRLYVVLKYIFYCGNKFDLMVYL